MMDNRGQAAAEYTLMLLMIVTLFLTVFKGVLLPALKNAEAQIEKKLDSLYSGDGLHQLHFKVPSK